MSGSEDSASSTHLQSPPAIGLTRTPWSIQTLLMALVLAALAPMVALLAYSTVEGYRQAQRQAARSAFALAQVAADSVEGFLRTTRETMAALAVRDDIRAMDPERCDPLYADFKSLYPQYSNFSQANLGGELICSSTPQPGGRATDVSDTAWFRSVMAGQHFVVAAPYTGVVTRRVVSVLAHPVRDVAGRMVGSIQLPVDLARFEPVVGADRLSATTVITVVAQNGSIVARSREPARYVGKTPRSPIIEEVLVQRSGTSLALSSEGIERVYGFVPIAGTDWYAVAGITAAAVFADARQGALRDGLVGVVVVVFASGLALALRRRITAPIQALRDTARRVGEGQTDARADTGGPLEVSAVATQLNAMLDARAASMQALAKREADLRRLFESSLEGILRCDAHGCVIAANPAAVALFGASALGTAMAADLATPSSPRRPGSPHWTDQVAPGEPRLAPLLQALAADGRARGELTMLRGDGSRFECAVSLSAFSTTDGSDGFTLFLRDQSEREAALAMRASKESAELANEAKSGFLARMSHELRTPLNAILGFAQLLKDEAPVAQSPRLAGMVGHVSDAGTHLLSLIDEVLDLSRIEAGAIALSPEPLDLSRLVRECLSLTASMAEQRRVTVTVAPVPLPAQGKHWIRADRTRVRQVVVNLLSNAIKYNRDAGSVTLELSSADGRVHLLISDTGWGLEPEQVANLFQPFNRLGAERSTVEGTGLGLVIVRQLLQMMGGEITVSSTPGIGSRFTLHFEAVTAPDVTLNGHTPAPAHDAAHGEGPSGTVLYIEDHPPNVELVRAVLGLRPRVELLTEVDGEAGLATALRVRPGLILLDLNLPGIDGYEVLRRLRLDPTTADIPCIALTANATQGESKRAMAAGFTAHMSKPFKISELLERVDGLLG